MLTLILSLLAREPRHGYELSKLIVGEHVDRGLQLIVDTGLAEHFFPELGLQELPDRARGGVGVRWPWGG